MSLSLRTREVVRALAVLALVFLNFAHVPAAAAAPAGDVFASIVSHSFCGGPSNDGTNDHAPCHACRIGAGADLPLAGGFAAPAFEIPIAFYQAAVPRAVPCRHPLTFGARGPPSA